MKKMLKNIFILLVLLLIVLGSVFSYRHFKEGTKANRPKLVVGTSADYPPYEFIKETNGKKEIVGFDIELSKYIANKLGMELDVKDASFDSLLVGLETGTYDMVLAGMTPSEERKALFSDIYYNATQKALIHVDEKEKIVTENNLKNKTVGVQLGSVQEEIVKEMKDVNVKSLESVQTLILELKTKKIDAVLLEKPVAESFNANNKDLEIAEKIEIYDEKGGSAVALKEGNTKLLEEVNKIIKEAKESNQIEKWVIEANNIMNNIESKNYTGFYIEGIKVTLLLSGIALTLGFFIAVILVIIRRSKYFWISLISKIIVEVLRGTPLVLQIFIVYFGSDVFGIKLSAFVSSLIAVSLNSAAYVSEIIRSGIESLPKGQTEAAKSLGMTDMQTMRLIILPQAIKNILPALGNEFVTLIKETSVAGMIGVAELMYQAKKIQSLSFEALKPLLITAGIYFVLTFTLSAILKVAEKRLKYDN